MAKLNIHDLAKELKREESEIISLCSSKGMSGVTRATMLQDTMVEEVRKAFKKPAEPADAAADKDGAPKKKLRLLFHPETAQSQFLKRSVQTVRRSRKVTRQKSLSISRKRLLREQRAQSRQKKHRRWQRLRHRRRI